MRKRVLRAAALFLLAPSMFPSPVPALATPAEPATSPADTTASRPESETPQGCLAGVVTEVDSGAPLDYANVLFQPAFTNTRYGEMSGEDGTFSADVPVGTYTIQVLYLGYRVMSIEDVIVREEEVTFVECQMIPIGLRPSDAAAESLGVDVQIEPGELRLETSAARPSYRVGDQIEFVIRIRNQSPETLFLPRVLGGSLLDARYPKLAIAVDGPGDGIVVHQPSLFCMNSMTSLQDHDLVEVKPGRWFYPFEFGIVGTPLPSLVGPFLKPGTYTVTVSYSMNEPDLRKWQGWPGISSVSAVMSERLRRLPMLDLTDSFEVAVLP